MQSDTRWHIVFSGRVQHVGMRYTALYLCRNLFLTGWVRNLEDGRVEMELQGSLTNLRRFMVKIKSMPHISIERAEIKETAPDITERGFHILH